MQHLLTIPHRPKTGMCPVNGIRDMVEWRTGRDWSNEFLWGLGQGGGFAYLRFNRADPPRQVYTGTATPRQHRYLANLFTVEPAEVENRAFQYSWGKAREAVDRGIPPVIGPLDMFHLHFYTGVYHQRHIPIHYLLLVGYDEDTAYVHDTGHTDVQAISLTDLQMAWDVNVPGLGRRNRLVVIDIPQKLPSTDVLIRKSISDQCQLMLRPPVNMVGIPAMKKVAREIALWPKELGEAGAARSLRQVLEYLNSPPDLEGQHLTAGRDLYVTFLQEAAAQTGLDFSKAIYGLRESIATVPALADAIRRNELEQAAVCFEHIAAVETTAYTELIAVISPNGDSEAR